MIRLPLALQSAVFMLALAGTGAWWFNAAQKDERVAMSIERARVAANQLQTTMDWAAKTNGIWYAEEPGTAFANKRESVAVYPPYSPDGPGRDGYRFFQRSPSSVVAELAEIMIKTGQIEGAGVLTAASTTVAPRTQREAYEAIASAPNMEYTKVVGDTLLYARALNVSAACMRCHDSIERAPASMQVKYRHDPTMFGYKLGVFVGALSVGVPLAQSAASPSDFLAARIPAMVFGLAVALTGVWFLFVVIAPVNKLARFSKVALSVDPAKPPSELHLVANEHRSRNELHVINDGLNTLLRSQHLLGAAPSPEKTSSPSAKGRFGSNTFESETF